MSLKKRAIEGIVVAGSLVMMSTIAQAADLDGVQVRNAAVQAETDFATGGTAGVVARLDQLEAEAFGNIEAATAGVNRQEDFWSLQRRKRFRIQKLQRH